MIVFADSRLLSCSSFCSSLAEGFPRIDFWHACSVAQKFMGSVDWLSLDWLRTGEADERDPVDDRLIEWLRKNPEIARELRIKAGLD